MIWLFVGTLLVFLIGYGLIMIDPLNLLDHH